MGARLRGPGALTFRLRLRAMANSDEPWDGRAVLFRELGGQLRGLGFHILPSGHGFRRSTIHGSDIVTLSMKSCRARFSVIARLSVRFDAVETLVNGCNPFLPEAEKKKTVTLGCELGRIDEGRGCEWNHIHSDCDVRSIGRDIAAAVVRLGPRHFERFSSERAVYAVLSSDDLEARLHAPMPLARASRAVALGFLIGGPAEAARMIEQKRRFLVEHHPEYALAFAAFANCVRTNTPSG